MRAARFVLVSSAVLFSACPGQRGQPSPDFERAHSAFVKLYAEKLDSAYADPRISIIEEDLSKVPQDSSDFVAAKDLKARIEEGRSRIESDEAERRKATDLALAPDREFVRSAPPVEELDAGPPSQADDANQPVAGMSRAEFDKRFSGCFAMGDPIDVAGRGVRDTFRLRDITTCREKHATMVDAAVLMEGNHVLGIVPVSSIRVAAAKDAGTAPPPAPTTADAGAAAPSTDAGTTSRPGWGGY